MQLITIVEEYVSAAMRHAVVEELEDGSLGATIPECFGVIAFGTDVHECATNLYAMLEDWVRESLRRGDQLPVIEGIDLNPQAAHVLASYHETTAGEEEPSSYFDDEDALERALESADHGSL